MNSVISKLSLLELEGTQEYYNLEKETSGCDFKDHIYEQVNKIKYTLYLYPIITDEVRRVVMLHFPFSIYYLVDNDTIVILSLFHQHIKPFYIQKQS